LLTLGQGPYNYFAEVKKVYKSKKVQIKFILLLVTLFSLLIISMSGCIEDFDLASKNSEISVVKNDTGEGSLGFSEQEEFSSQTSMVSGSGSSETETSSQAESEDALYEDFLEELEELEKVIAGLDELTSEDLTIPDP
jgi:hypothetical protein